MRTSTRRKPTKRKPKGDDVLDSPYLWVTILICYVLAVAYCVFWVYGPSVTGLSQGKLPGSSEKAYFVSSEFATEDAKENENPYADTLLVDFIIGNRFANYTGSLGSQGISVSVESGREIDLPAVATLNGYVFKGWSAGGVDNIEIDAEEKTASFERGDEGQWHMTLYAVYADKDGNLYCSCGDYREAGNEPAAVTLG